MKELFLTHIAQTSDAPVGLEISHAKGPFIYTTDGKQYTDFISGIAVSSLGHGHPKVVAAIKEQAGKHLHVMVYGEFVQKPQVQLAELLLSQLPGPLERIYFVNSGTEAVEGALKLAKKYTGRHKFVSFKNSYHGDTHGSLSVTGRDVYRKPYLPLLPDVSFFDFNGDAVLQAISRETAAVIMEPIQGEGGIIPANRDWLQALREKCTATGTLLIFDEIQTGFMRTGTLFAFQGYEVVPDILCMAKAMGGGMPLGGFAASSEIFEVFKTNPPLNHVTTFGGHPVSCAAAFANLEELLQGNYGGRALEIEDKVKAVLKGKGITEVRGKGAMLGLQLQNRALTQAVVEECLQQGLLLGWTLHSDTLIRLAPPLIISDEVLEQSLDTILSSIRRHYRGI